MKKDEILNASEKNIKIKTWRKWKCYIWQEVTQVGWVLLYVVYFLCYPLCLPILRFTVLGLYASVFLLHNG